MLPLLAALTLGLTALPQDAKRPDDVVQKRDGGLLVGRVLKVESDALEILVTGEQTSRRLFFRDLMPYSVYKIRVDRIDKASGPARMDLAEFCMQQGLYTQAVREFEEAKKLHQKKDYDEAVRLLHLLLEARYEGTPYQAEAKALAAKIAEEIKLEKEELKKQIDAAAAKKDAAKAEAKAQQEADVFNRTVALLEEAQKAWAEGLDQEPKNQTRAEKAWRAAEAALFGVKKNVDTMIKSNDVEQIKKAKELDKQADLWLVRTYYRLGRMFAVDLNYPTSLEWLNKAMKIPHDEATDRMINDVLLTISQLKMRERAAGRGY